MREVEGESAKVKTESGALLRLSQDYLETGNTLCSLEVIPQIGGKVMIVKGRHRGEEGTLVEVNFDKYYGTVKRGNGNTVDLDYADFCKLST